MKNAAHAGISISDFWEMTPAEIGIYIMAYIDRTKVEFEERISVAYFGACMQRSKKMPPLSKYIKNENKKKATTPESILEEVKRLNAEFGGDTY